MASIHLPLVYFSTILKYDGLQYAMAYNAWHDPTSAGIHSEFAGASSFSFLFYEKKRIVTYEFKIVEIVE